MKKVMLSLRLPVTLLVFVSLLLTACVAPAGPATGATGSKPAAAAPAAATGEVSRADTLIFAKDLTDIITLDPAVAYEFSGLLAEGSFYETLVSVEPGKPGVKPLLAEKWDVAEEGDMWKVTFHLNAKAKFASGKPVTADDFVYSWTRALDLNKSPAFLLSDTSGVKKENMKAVDPQTFEVKIPKSVSPQVFLAAISFTVAAAVEKAVVEPNKGSDNGSSWLNDHSAGSGAYVLNKWERDQSVTLDANPNYWGTPAKIKRVIIKNIPELTNLQSAVETGDADIVQDLGPEQKTALASNADVTLSTFPNTELVYIGMNAQKAPFDNADVREAIRYAINYDEILALLKGNGQIVQEIIPAGFLGNTGNNPFKQDIAKAKELLAKAGLKEGTEIEALVPSGLSSGGLDFPTLAAKVQSDLAKAGLKLNLKQMQTSELLGVYRKQGAVMVFLLWGPDYPDPDGNVNPFTNYAAKSIAWRNGWEAKDIAELSKQAAVETDGAKRAKLYADISTRVLHEGPYAILYQPTRTFGVRKNIDGFFFDANDTPGVNFAAISKK